MKVLFLANRCMADPLAGGGEIHLNILAERLSEMGHRVTYVCRDSQGATGRRNGVDIVGLGQSLFAARVFSWYMREARGRYDVVVEQVFGGFRMPFLTRLYCSERLVGVWYQQNKRIFFKQFPRPVAAALTAFEYLVAFLYRDTRLVTDSGDAKSDLVGIGLDSRMIDVMPPGPFLEPSQGRVAQDNPKRERLIITVGKIRRYKSYHHVLEPLKRLLPEHPDLKVIIAGKRDDLRYESEINETIKKLGLGDSAALRLNLSEEEKQGLMERACALVVPSPVEGFGMVVLEANRFGTPVIASSGVPRDAVAEGINGLRYDYGDIDALTARMRRLLDDDFLWGELSRGAVEYSRQFDWEFIARDFERLLMKELGTEEMPLVGVDVVVDYPGMSQLPSELKR